MNVILSIKPKFAEAIFAGKKEVEFRKTLFKKDVDKVLVYSTAPVQKIVGYFTIADIVESSPDQLWQRFGKIGYINEEEFFKYYRNTQKGYSLCIATADIPFLVPQLSENHFRFMNAVVGHLAVSSIPTLVVNSLCKKWGIGKEKLYQLLNAMEAAKVIRVVRKKNDVSLNSIGAKLFLYEPSVYEFFGGNTGNVRESYVAGVSMESNRKAL